jgi:hypothetical protein
MSEAPLIGSAARLLEAIAAGAEGRDEELARRLRLAARFLHEHARCAELEGRPRAARRCGCGCGAALPERTGPGRPAIYLNPAHRRRAWRERKRDAMAPSPRRLMVRTDKEA